MKKLLLLIALLLPALFVTAQGIKNGLKEEPKINVGIKGGFNSSMYFTSRLELDGERMEDVQNNYKVGYFAAMFFRVHMKRHFIQPEIMYNIYKGEIAFNKNQNNENIKASMRICNKRIVCDQCYGTADLRGNGTAHSQRASDHRHHSHRAYSLCGYFY